MTEYKVIGVMSGTSMDGLDLVHCTLNQTNGTWNYKINAAKTIDYDEKWRLRLSKLRSQSAFNFVRTDRYYGEYIGLLINDFLSETKLSADLISFRDQICALVLPGGRLIVSGISRRHLSEVLESFAAVGASLLRIRRGRSWCAVLFTL